MVELLVVMTISFILVGIACPAIDSMQEEAQTAAMAATVRRVRHEIWYHASMGDVASCGGRPDGLNPDWFEGGRLPLHPATGEPLAVDVVSAGKAEIYPGLKSFAASGAEGPAGHTAWYNRSNGAFCLKVPHHGSRHETLARFHEVNAGIPGDP